MISIRYGTLHQPLADRVAVQVRKEIEIGVAEDVNEAGSHKHIHRVGQHVVEPGPKTSCRVRAAHRTGSSEVRRASTSRQWRSMPAVMIVMRDLAQCDQHEHDDGERRRKNLKHANRRQEVNRIIEVPQEPASADPS